jgi:tetratricopeptide (TPR) repeat protein
VDAVESFKAGLRYCPDNLLALEGAAQIEYTRRQPDAEGLLERILKLQPNAVTAHAMLASMYRAKGECARALPQFAASSQIFAQRPKYQQAYAYCLADTGHYKQAAANYEQLSGSDPDPAVRFNLALVQWKMHEAKKALATLQPLVAGTHQEAVLALGARLAEETGDTPTAVKLLREAMVEQPKNLANYMEFAQIAFNHQSAQVGIDVINAGLTQLPDAAQLYLARGVLEVQVSKFDAAIADFEKAHKLAPQLSLAMDAMGIIESQQYKQTAALDLYRKEARLHPKDSLLQYLYAEALSESGATKGATEKAIAAAERSVAVEPNYAPARDLLALLYLRRNDPQKALAEAQAALKIHPTDDVALYHEIMARRRLGQTAEVGKLVKDLAQMRKENAQRQKAGQRFVLKDEMGH